MLHTKSIINTVTFLTIQHFNDNCSGILNLKFLLSQNIFLDRKTLSRI